MVLASSKDVRYESGVPRRTGRILRGMPNLREVRSGS